MTSHWPAAHLVEPMHHLYSNTQGVFKREDTLSELFSTYNGYGQGDVLSLLPAMLLVSWQFKMLDVRFPSVEKGAYYDDRNFRGSRDQLNELDKQLHMFDAMAGHITQADKTAFVCTNSKDKKWLQKIKLGGCVPKCPQYVELVGCMVTSAKQRQCALQDKRLSRTINSIARIIAAPVGAARRIRAFCAKAIPMAIYGMQWGCPSVAMATRFRSKALRCIWGSSSKMRCMEVVVGVLNDPTKVDHYYAAAYRSILDARRMLLKSSARYDQFILLLMRYDESEDINGVTGPVHGLVANIGAIGAEIKIDGNQIFICTKLRTKVDLLTPHRTHLQACIREACRHTVMRHLQQRDVDEKKYKGARFLLMFLRSSM